MKRNEHVNHLVQQSRCVGSGQSRYDDGYSRASCHEATDPPLYIIQMCIVYNNITYVYVRVYARRCGGPLFIRRVSSPRLFVRPIYFRKTIFACCCTHSVHGHADYIRIRTCITVYAVPSSRK